MKVEVIKPDPKHLVFGVIVSLFSLTAIFLLLIAPYKTAVIWILGAAFLFFLVLGVHDLLRYRAERTVYYTDKWAFDEHLLLKEQLIDELEKAEQTFLLMLTDDIYHDGYRLWFGGRYCCVFLKDKYLKNNQMQRLYICRRRNYPVLVKYEDITPSDADFDKMLHPMWFNPTSFMREMSDPVGHYAPNRELYDLLAYLQDSPSMYS